MKGYVEAVKKDLDIYESDVARLIDDASEAAKSIDTAAAAMIEAVKQMELIEAGIYIEVCGERKEGTDKFMFSNDGARKAETRDRLSQTPEYAAIEIEYNKTIEAKAVVEINLAETRRMIRLRSEQMANRRALLGAIKGVE